MIFLSSPTVMKSKSLAGEKANPEHGALWAPSNKCSSFWVLASQSATEPLSDTVPSRDLFTSEYLRSWIGWRERSHGVFFISCTINWNKTLNIYGLERLSIAKAMIEWNKKMWTGACFRVKRSTVQSQASRSFSTVFSILERLGSQ